MRRMAWLVMLAQHLMEIGRGPVSGQADLLIKPIPEISYKNEIICTKPIIINDLSVKIIKKKFLYRILANNMDKVVYDKIT
jgi:hypothetical protein